MKAICVSVFVLGLLAAAAQAGDLCLDATAFLAGPPPPTLDHPVVILRGFKFPKKNKCKPFTGVISTAIPSRPSAVTGSACTSFAGGGVSFTIVATLAPTGTGPGDDPGVELRYTAHVTPAGSSDGAGSITRIEPNATTSFRVATFECHNAFPDNL